MRVCVRRWEVFQHVPGEASKRTGWRARSSRLSLSRHYRFSVDRGHINYTAAIALCSHKHLDNTEGAVPLRVLLYSLSPCVYVCERAKVREYVRGSVSRPTILRRDALSIAANSQSSEQPLHHHRRLVSPPLLPPPPTYTSGCKLTRTVCKNSTPTARRYYW